MPAQIVQLNQHHHQHQEGHHQAIIQVHQAVTITVVEEVVAVVEVDLPHLNRKFI
jgi:hypothetical protein